jgi:hypothetical protein
MYIEAITVKVVGTIIVAYVGSVDYLLWVYFLVPNPSRQYNFTYILVLFLL